MDEEEDNIDVRDIEMYSKTIIKFLKKNKKASVNEENQKRRIIRLVARNKELREISNRYKKSLKPLERENVKLQQMMTLGLPNIIHETVTKELASFNERNIEVLKELHSGVKDTENLLATISQTITEREEQMHVKFKTEYLDDLKSQLENAFYDEMVVFFEKITVDSEIKEFVNSKVQTELRKYSINEFEPLVKFIFKRLAHKYNVLISKDIIKKIPEMSSIQVQELKGTIEKLKEKEIAYLNETKEGIKSLTHLGETANENH